MNGASWLFHSLDTWFFRESRPHGSVGGAILESRFPPSAPTLAGAVRTAIGQYVGVDWEAFKIGAGVCQRDGLETMDLHAAIGTAVDGEWGQLQLAGPWLHYHGSRLFPVPLDILEMEGGDCLFRLTIGPPFKCDLGTVCLPERPPQAKGTKSPEGAWVDGAGLSAILAGGLPERLYRPGDLFQREPRLGIARDGTGTTIDGLLYLTRHVRPKPEVALEMIVNGLDPALQPPSGHVVRLGGEGRVGVLEIVPSAPLPATPRANADTRGLILYLLTPADLEGQWLPGRQTESVAGDQPFRTWPIHLQGHHLQVVSSVLGKASRQGGWNLACNRPRPTRSLVPAGSAWFVTLPEGGDPNRTIKDLHGRHIGLNRESGQGLLAVGLWQKGACPPELK